MYVWGVNSTVTKHSDYFVSKDTSERVTPHCDDTVDKKRVNSFVLKYFFWRELSNRGKQIVRKPWKCSLRRATNVTFSKICGWHRPTWLRRLRPAPTKSHCEVAHELEPVMMALPDQSMVFRAWDAPQFGWFPHRPSAGSTAWMLGVQGSNWWPPKVILLGRAR